MAKSTCRPWFVNMNFYCENWLSGTWKPSIHHRNKFSLSKNSFLFLVALSKLFESQTLVLKLSVKSMSRPSIVHLGNFSFSDSWLEGLKTHQRWIWLNSINVDFFHEQIRTLIRMLGDQNWKSVKVVCRVWYPYF